MNDAKIKELLAEYGFLAENDASGDLERSVKDQLTRAATKDEVDTVAFGLETDDGKIVKVYVNAEHAEKFETEMAEMLGEVDDIEEALNQISKDIEVVDVEWPEDDEEGDEASDVDENADDDLEDEEDGSEVMNSKVYSKKNLEKEKVKEDTTFGQDITQDLLLETNQNSIANQLSTVNQHLIYQAILHLGVPELAMDKSPYRSAILKGIRNTALELTHAPTMRNTLKMFIKQQVIDDARAPEEEKFRGDAAKQRHHGDEYAKGLKAAGAVHHNEPHDKKPVKPVDTVKPEKKQPPVKSKYEVKEDENDSAVGMFWSSLDALMGMLDPTEGKEHVERLKSSQQFKSLAARSNATLIGRLTSGIRTKLKALQAALGAKEPAEVAEAFTNIDAVELLSSMLRLADSQGYADRVIQSQVFKRLSLAGRSTFASVPASVKRILQALMAEVGKVKLQEADELSFDDPESKGAAPSPQEEPAKEPAAAPTPPPAPVSPDASESGVTFKADGDSLEVKFDGGKISLSGESLERAMKALTNKQTLSVQLDGGKFATVSPRGSSAVIKLMGTESVIKLAPPDISAFIDAAEQVAAGEVENKPAEETEK